MPMLIVGPRGVGKTVVLDEISRAAGERHGWPRIWVEASVSVPPPTLVAHEAESVQRVAADALARRASGLVVVVDEAQAATREDFARLVSTVRRAVGDQLPMIVLVASTPPRPGERWRRRPLLGGRGSTGPGQAEGAR